VTEIAVFVSGIYESGSEDKSQAQQMNNASSKSPQVSLSRIILSLESHVSKQQALKHVLNALQVLHAREAVVAALSSHSNIAGFASTGKPSAHIYSKFCRLFVYLRSDIHWMLQLSSQLSCFVFMRSAVRISFLIKIFCGFL
jgi:hypothetical protein